MTRKLVSKREITDIKPIENADSLELAFVTGWQVVVKKGEFKVGDTILYFEIDSALNPHDDRFSFLMERCYKKFMAYGNLFDECLRIKTIKLRGVLSQGLIMPCNIFCEVRNKKIGEDCSDVLYVRNYDDVAEKASRENGSTPAAYQKGKFPDWAFKTDEERIQNLTDYDIEEHVNDPMEVTEKIDGTSFTIMYSPSNRPDDPIAVCSRNFELKDMPSPYWDIVHRFDLDKKLTKYCSEIGMELAIQGEISGPGISSNRDNASERSLNVFRVYDIRSRRYLGWSERYEVCRKLGIDHVPVIGYMTMRKFSNEETDGMVSDFQNIRESILKYAEGKTARGNEREGVVFKSVTGNFSFKAVSNAYLMKIK